MPVPRRAKKTTRSVTTRKTTKTTSPASLDDLVVQSGHVTMPALHLYRKVVVSFVAVTVLLVGVIIYFTFISATIEIFPAPETVTTDVSVTVATADQLAARFMSAPVEGRQEFPATGEKKVTTDVVGTVTITSTYRLPQPLIATTRLATADGLILRIKDRIDIPANGSVDVAVYPDDLAGFAEKTIAGGTKLTIPGLRPEKQDDIYGVAKGSIVAGEQTVTFVSAEDISSATKQLTEQLISQALADSLGSTSDLQSTRLINPQVTVSVEVDNEVDRFTVSLKGTVEGLVVNRAKLLAVASTSLDGSLPDDRQLLVVDESSLAMTIDQLDTTLGTATVTVHLEGTSILRVNSPLLDKDKLKGLRREQVEAYFKSQPAVESVKVNFFPFWLRKVPSLPGHIDIVVRQQ